MRHKTGWVVVAAGHRALRVWRRRRWTERCCGRDADGPGRMLRRTPLRRRRATSRCRSTPSRMVRRPTSARPVRSTQNDICSRCLLICRRCSRRSLHAPSSNSSEVGHVIARFDGERHRHGRRRLPRLPVVRPIRRREDAVDERPGEHGCVDVRRRRSFGLPRFPARRRRRGHRHGSRADPRCRHDPSPCDGQAARRFEQRDRCRARSTCNAPSISWASSASPLLDAEMPADVFIDDNGMVREIGIRLLRARQLGSTAAKATLTVDLFDFGAMSGSTHLRPTKSPT